MVTRVIMFQDYIDEMVKWKEAWNMDLDTNKFDVMHLGALKYKGDASYENASYEK